MECYQTRAMSWEIVLDKIVPGQLQLPAWLSDVCVVYEASARRAEEFGVVDGEVFFRKAVWYEVPGIDWEKWALILRK